MSQLFIRNKDINKNAYPNWRRSIYFGDDFFNYADMFKDSADRLIDSIKEQNTCKEADKVINPALYLYRHSIELLLKAIVTMECLVTGMKKDKLAKKLNGHDLKYLWDIANPVIKKYFIEDIKRDKKSFDYLEESISELYNLDEKSFIFRYPYDIKLKIRKVGDGEAHYGFDYMVFKNKINELYEYLEGCYNVVFEVYDHMS